MGRNRAFMVGAGSLIDLCGQRTARALRPGASRKRGIDSDWRAVGNDLRNAGTHTALAEAAARAVDITRSRRASTS